MEKDKNQDSDGLSQCFIRRCVGIVLLLLCLPLVYFRAVFPALALGAVGGVLMVPDITSYFAELAGRILWSHKEPAPSPSYGIAETFVARGKYVEAEAEYERIIERFPDDVKPHIDMIKLAITRLNDGELAAKLFERGISFLKEPADREALSKAYERIRTLRRPEDMTRTVVSSDHFEKARAKFERDRRKLWR